MESIIVLDLAGIGILINCLAVIAILSFNEDVRMNIMREVEANEACTTLARYVSAITLGLIILIILA